MDVKHNDDLSGYNQNITMNNEEQEKPVFMNGHSTKDAAIDEPLLNGHGGHQSNNLSTSPSKQKVIDTISEVINDRLLEDHSTTPSMLLTEEKERKSSTDLAISSAVDDILEKVESTSNTPKPAAETDTVIQSRSEGTTIDNSETSTDTFFSTISSTTQEDDSTTQYLTPSSDSLFDSPPSVDSVVSDVPSPDEHVVMAKTDVQKDDELNSFKDSTNSVVIEKDENPLPEEATVTSSDVVEPMSAPIEESKNSNSGVKVDEIELNSETLIIENAIPTEVVDSQETAVTTQAEVNNSAIKSTESNALPETSNSTTQEVSTPTEANEDAIKSTGPENETPETSNNLSTQEDTKIDSIDENPIVENSPLNIIEPTITTASTTVGDVLEKEKESDKTDEVKEKKKPAEEWLDMLGNGLLKKKVLKEGAGRESRPQQGDLVNVRCEGRLDDGTVVDKHSNLQLVLGDADTIQAIDMCVALMEDHEICTLYTDTRYAYGLFGRLDYKPAIPKNANITYEIEILSIERSVPLQELSSQECSLRADKKRGRGNDLYSRGDYAGAIDVYKRALKYLEGRTDKELLDMKVKCLNNLSAAQLKVKAYIMALQSLNVVLELEPKNVKALFRKGKCLEKLGKENAAFECMKKAAALDPENKLIVQDLGRLRSRVAVTQQKEKQIYQRMFQQDANKQQEEQGVEGEHEEEDEEEDSYLPLIGSAVVAAAACIGGLLWYRYR